MTQKADILAWIKANGSISALEAMMHLHCYRLAARILELRQDGHKIETEMEDHDNGQHARYFFE